MRSWLRTSGIRRIPVAETARKKCRTDPMSAWTARWSSSNSLHPRPGRASKDLWVLWLCGIEACLDDWRLTAMGMCRATHKPKVLLSNSNPRTNPVLGYVPKEKHLPSVESLRNAVSLHELSGLSLHMRKILNTCTKVKLHHSFAIANSLPGHTRLSYTSAGLGGATTNMSSILDVPLFDLDFGSSFGNGER